MTETTAEDLAAEKPTAEKPTAEGPTAEQSIETRRNLLGVRKGALAEVLAPFIDRKFRVDQIYRAIYEQGATDFDQITALSKDLRQTLSKHFSLALPEVADRHQAADLTTKYLFRLQDGATIEAVDIPDGKRRTLCVSSQAGCALACRFCVTGYWGGGRNLTAGEIVAQVFSIWDPAEQNQESRGLNLVFMGMGEPLSNLDNLKDALDILMEKISWRRITVSTAGVIPGIEAMAGWKKRPKLAISLHAPDDQRRSELMPINRKYPLADLLGTLKRFPLTSKERITFEYLLIDRYNDEPADADELATLLKGLRAKVNLIPLNPDPVLDPRLREPSAARTEAFRRRLVSRGVLTTVRKRRGDDVSAACGQLRAPDRDPRGFRRSALSL